MARVKVNLDVVVTLGIKPVSNNKIHSGRRYKTTEAKDFENVINILLSTYARDIKLPETGDLELITRVYVSRKMDTSNCLKLLEDCIARYFGINDRRFAGHRISRIVVKPGNEKIKFKIQEYDDKYYEL